MLSLLSSHYRVYKGIMLFKQVYSWVLQTSLSKTGTYHKLRKALDQEGNFVFPTKTMARMIEREKGHYYSSIHLNTPSTIAGLQKLKPQRDKYQILFLANENNQ